MRYFPTFVDLKDKPVLVVGAAAPGLAKARLLGQAGARVAVLTADRRSRRSGEWSALGVDWLDRSFRPADVLDYTMVISATGSDTDNAVSQAATAAGIPVNVVDRPELSSFITPAIVDRDPVVIAVSTGGAAPALARMIRHRIEAVVPGGIGRLAEFLAAFRASVKAVIPRSGQRAFWDRVIRGPIARLVLNGAQGPAREAMITAINASDRCDTPPGRVTLVGAGPGDDDLLTLRALHALQDADVVIHDRLVGRDVLDYARRDATRIYVGKQSGRHATPQPGIHRLMVHHVRRGRHVVRLKGGDPFIFGRGGEELAYLQAHGVAVEVVPGITAATACADATGIPLTHRGIAEAVTFVTGHRATGAPEPDWSGLARADHTLVIYMGVSNAGVIAARLIDHGLSGSTPVAVIENGSLPDQRATVGTLETLTGIIDSQNIKPPAVIIVGRVVTAVDDTVIAEDLAPMAAAAGG